MFIQGTIILLLLIKSCKCHVGSLTIGVISQDVSRISPNSILEIGHNVTADNYIIDTKELYELYITVQTLDKNDSIDVIILLDDEPIDELSRYLFKPENKKLIKWGQDGGLIQTINHHTFGGSVGKLTKHCDNYYVSHTTQDGPYCVMNRNSTKYKWDEGIATLLPKMVSSVVLSLSWKHVIILYETTTERETSRLVDILSQKRILFVMFNLDLVNDLSSLLRRMYETKVEKERSGSEMNMVVLCQRTYTEMILKRANEFDKSSKDRKTLMKKFSKWLVVSNGYCRGASNNLQEHASDLDNVAVIAIPTESKLTEDFVATLNDIIYDVNKAYLNDDTMDFATAVIERIEEETRSKCSGYIIDTLLWTKSGREFNPIGHVDRNGHVILDTDIFPNVHYGYNKEEFLVSTLPYAPFVMKKVVNGTVTYEGFCIDLLIELSRILNFTYKMTEPADGLWGVFVNKNNLTFNGLVGQVQRREVDIIAAPLADQPDRRQVMDFSIPFYYEYVSVIFKKPNPDARKWRKLLDPLKWEVLVSIGLVLIVVTVLTFVIERNNPFYFGTEHAKERIRKGGLHTWPGAFWYLYGALLCQGGVHLPASTTGRTILSFWWLFCIIIVGTYCGNLIAFLTVTKEVHPFSTLTEMLELKGTYTWGTPGGTAWEMILRTSTNPTFRAVGQAMVEFNRSDPGVLSVNMSEQLEKVREGDFVWIGDKTSIDLEMMTECDLMSTKEEFMPSKYSFGFTNNSPHNALFSEQLMKIQESGLLQIWKQKWWPKANFCNRNAVTEAKPISLEDVQSAFYVCCIGIFIGILTLMMEMVIHKCFRKTKMLDDYVETNSNSSVSGRN